MAHNFDLIKDAMASPDFNRPSKSNPNAEIVYKKCARICISPGITVPSPCKYIAVVIENKSNERFVKTFYPTNRIKEMR